MARGPAVPEEDDMGNVPRQRPRSISMGRSTSAGAYDASSEAKVGKQITPQPNGCWAWRNDLTTYGTVNAVGRPMRAHRYVYDVLVGPVPDGHHLHHKCQNPGCVNPDHLEPLTPSEHRAEHVRLASA